MLSDAGSTPAASTISLAVILVKLRRAFCVDTLMFELDREVYCMKKVLSVSIKTIIFFVGWAICVSVIPIPDTASAVIWRFWAELIPLLSVIAITLIFWLADQKKIRLHLTGKPVYNIILGGVTGTIWLGASVGILSILGVVQIEGKNQIAMLWLWLLAAFLNTVMQEMLVRGYLYQMIKSNGIENELEESKFGFVGTCKQYVRISFVSVKLYCRQKWYSVLYLLRVAWMKVVSSLDNLIKPERIRISKIRFLEVTTVIELLLLDMVLFVYLGSEDSCARFFELFSTVVVIPILLSSLASLKER